MQSAKSANGQAFVCAMTSKPATEPDTTTWNGAPSLSTTGGALVDLFFKGVRGLARDDLEDLLVEAWGVEPTLTLKMVGYLRNVRGGKGERDLGRHGLAWLAAEHPDHLLFNLPSYLGKFGRWDDAAHLVASPTPEVAEGVYRVYAEQLCRDMELLEGAGAGQDASVSLCAKWTPSEGKALDRKHGFNRGLARAMGVTNKRLRAQLTTLRRKIDLLEHHLCEGTLEEVDYSRVPSVAMNRHGKAGKAFARRDGDRFSEYKSGLATGETKVNTGALYPHEIVKDYLSGCSRGSGPDELTEGQWLGMTERLTPEERAHLSGVLTMVDVSGSMSCGLGKGGVRPIDVAVSLGLLVSEMNPDSAFHRTVMTFSSEPEFYRVQGATLYDRVHSLQRADWGMSTDFAKAFRCILAKAKQHRLSQEELPTTLLVISDMQFDNANQGSQAETNFEALGREFRQAGYEAPRLVFWNVNGSTTDFPVPEGQKGVALISGFSVEILRDVLTGEDVTPFRVMLRALQRPDYDCLELAPAEPIRHRIEMGAGAGDAAGEGGVTDSDDASEMKRRREGEADSDW